MAPFRNILVVVDPMPPKRFALDRAVQLARTTGASLTLLSVVKDAAEIPDEAQAGLSGHDLTALVVAHRLRTLTELTRAPTRQGIDIRIGVKTGTPFIEIIREVVRNGHDLVMMSAEGRGGLRQRLFGTTSMHLMRKCPCPVLVLKRKQGRFP
uniref:universal stress protein n=1 Tax=Thiocapsa sp. TaxID=2024551 RepID=UPI0035930DA5